MRLGRSTEAFSQTAWSLAPTRGMSAMSAEGAGITRVLFSTLSTRALTLSPRELTMTTVGATMSSTPNNTSRVEARPCLPPRRAAKRWWRG
ncbi:hypothetical protein D3C79_774600 [compost metagenome]